MTPRFTAENHLYVGLSNIEKACQCALRKSATAIKTSDLPYLFIIKLCNSMTYSSRHPFRIPAWETIFPSLYFFWMSPRATSVARRYFSEPDTIMSIFFLGAWKQMKWVAAFEISADVMPYIKTVRNISTKNHPSNTMSITILTIETECSISGCKTTSLPLPTTKRIFGFVQFAAKSSNCIRTYLDRSRGRNYFFKRIIHSDFMCNFSGDAVLNTLHRCANNLLTIVFGQSKTCAA